MFENCWITCDNVTIVELLKECKFSGDLDMEADLFVSVLLIVLKF